MMGHDEFAVRLVSGLLEARTGQTLSKDRHWRIETALAGLFRERGITTLDQFTALLLQPGQNKFAQDVVEALLNNETYFFRDRQMFDLLSQRVLPELAEKRAASRRISIWSAGCSSGQETISLAMMFAEQFTRWAGWTIEILGTDISSSVIKSAREGCYSQFQVQRGLGIGQMLNNFTETSEGWRVNRMLHKMIRFEVHNLLDPPPQIGQFDLVLCRNVLLYFDSATRGRAFDRIAQAMAPDAFLMLGGGETATGHTDRISPCAEMPGMFRLTSYRNRDAQAPRLGLTG